MKNVKVWLAILALTTVCSGNIWSQNRPKAPRKAMSPEQRIEMRVERMQRHLMLDDKTAAQFAPVYKEYLQALEDCKPQKPETKPAAMDDKQIEEHLTAQFEQQQKLLDTRKEYYNKFKKMLTMRQVQMVLQSDRPHPMMPKNKQMKDKPQGPCCLQQNACVFD